MCHYIHNVNPGRQECISFFLLVDARAISVPTVYQRFKGLITGTRSSRFKVRAATPVLPVVGSSCSTIYYTVAGSS